MPILQSGRFVGWALPTVRLYSVCARRPAAAPIATAVAFRDDQQLAEITLARAARGQRALILEREVYDAPVARAHRIERNRLAAPSCAFRQAVRELFERVPAAIAIILRVDHDAPGAFILARDDTIGDVLERIESLAAATDE